MSIPDAEPTQKRIADEDDDDVVCAQRTWKLPAVSDELAAEALDDGRIARQSAITLDGRVAKEAAETLEAPGVSTSAETQEARRVSATAETQEAPRVVVNAGAQGADGTQEIRAEDVLEVVESVERAKPPSKAPPAPKPSAAQTQEVRAADILEAVPIPAPSVDILVEHEDPIAAPPPKRVEPPSQRRHTASSIAPIAIEIPPPPSPRFVAPEPRVSADSSIAPLRVGPPRRLRAIVEVAMATSLLILAAGAVRAHMSSEPEGPPIILTQPNTSSATAPPATVDVQNLPAMPTTGTIARADAARVVIDGTKLSASSAVVPCGSHVLRIGNAKPRSVDVPCGGTLSIDAAGKISGH